MRLLNQLNMSEIPKRSSHAHLPDARSWLAGWTAGVKFKTSRVTDFGLM